MLTDNLEYKKSIIENYLKINNDISELCYRKSLGEVQICAATKTVAACHINVLYEYGLKIIGENRVNELKEKRSEYNDNFRVDYIGTLQSNKINYLVDNVSVIQTLCTENSLKEIERCGKNKNINVHCLVEINSAGEESKSGLLPDEVDTFFEKISLCKHICVDGLMTLGSVDKSNRCFCLTKNIFEYLKKYQTDNIHMNTLSMGMSDSYLDAIECGSNMVRPGKIIFGLRN